MMHTFDCNRLEINLTNAETKIICDLTHKEAEIIGPLSIYRVLTFGV